MAWSCCWHAGLTACCHHPQPSVLRCNVHVQPDAAWLCAQGPVTMHDVTPDAAACLLPLHHQAQFRGYFVPPRPEKNAVEGQRMSDAFVEERRLALQKYLQKLAAHPAIGPSEVGSCCSDPPADMCATMWPVAWYVCAGICRCVDARYLVAPGRM